MTSYDLNSLLTFLNNSPTAWHAVDQLKESLKKAGFKELHETSQWNLQKGERYFLTRDGSSLCAFINSTSIPTSTKLLASHLDSPALKLKPQPEIKKQNMILFGVEIYGAPLLSSWLNRDLGIAGRVFYEDAKGNCHEALVNLTENPVIIPQLAIHLDREVNEKGLILNKQDHLNALAAIDDKVPKGPYLETILKKKLKYKHLLSFDLFLYPLEKARWTGYQQQMISSYRIDSLASVHAAAEALINHTKPDKHEIKLLALWNNEEIGSETAQGAASPFLASTLERILHAHKQDREAYLRLVANSTCVSIDLSHAWHPNYPEKHDSNHQPLLGKGIVLKHNAQQRYATDAKSALIVYKAAKKGRLALQKFASRNDIPSGSTIGPIHAGSTGMPTVDIGCSQLSMHSSRELMSSADQLSLYHLLSHYLKS